MPRQAIAAISAGALALVLSSALVVAQEDAGAGLSRAEAVAVVLDSDPRFAELGDWWDLQREASMDFRSLEAISITDYFRVLGPTMSEWSDLQMVTLRYPASWLVEVTLVDGCPELERVDEFPLEDPCEWRHMWVYLVGPDGSLTTVLEEGDPDPGPE